MCGEAVHALQGQSRCGGCHLEAKIAVAVVPVINDSRVEGLHNSTTHNNQQRHVHGETVVSKEHQTTETHISMFLHNIKRIFADHWRRQPVLRVVVVEQVSHHSWWEEEQDGVLCVSVSVCVCVSD